jgi:diphthamide biosynthesis protein 2
MESEALVGYNLHLAVSKIKEYHFHRIVLQIPDELLPICVEIYDYFVTSLSDETIEIFMTADSTFGSSIDDISAEHVNSDLLIYFGTDSSSCSCSIPMMILSQQLPLENNEIMIEMILQYIHEKTEIDLMTFTCLVVDPSYHHLMDQLYQSLHSHFPNLLLGQLPPTSNLSEWTPISSQSTVDSSVENIGGLFFPLDTLSEIQTVLYIGKKREQLISLLLRMSHCTVVSYTPSLPSSSSSALPSPPPPAAAQSQLSHHVGVNSREYRERYAGVLRVQDASIIGLIIGSMSLSGELTRVILKQLTELIETSGRKCYCFVMGRLNEAKLCNFPEVKSSSLSLC